MKVWLVWILLATAEYPQQVQYVAQVVTPPICERLAEVLTAAAQEAQLLEQWECRTHRRDFDPDWDNWEQQEEAP